MKKEVKKVKATNNKKILIEVEDMRKLEKNKKKILEFIKDNPGTRMRELADIYDCDFLDDYEFFQTMIILFNENAFCEDSGHYFSDWETRANTRY